MAEVIKDMPFFTYLNLQAVSSHGLATAAKSIAHYFYELENPRAVKDTASFRFGRLVHTAILQHWLFDSTYIVVPDTAKKPVWNKNKANYSQEEKEWVAFDEAARARGLEKTTGADADAAFEIRDKLSKDDVFCDIMNGCEAEVTITWSELDILCKAKPDLINRRIKLLLDLKTTLCARKEDFVKDVYNLHYLHQLAWYKRACAAAGIEITKCVILAVEKEPPYEYAFYELNRDDLALADQSNLRVLHKINEARVANTRPGYPRGIQNLRVSDWAKTCMQGEIENA